MREEGEVTTESTAWLSIIGLIIGIIIVIISAGLIITGWGYLSGTGPVEVTSTYMDLGILVAIAGIGMSIMATKSIITLVGERVRGEMRCEACGRVMPRGSKFCDKCGTRMRYA